VGSYLYLTSKREEKRLAEGWAYEPESFYEKNEAALALEEAEASLTQVEKSKIQWDAPKSAPAFSKS
jgi:hypothetical protein